MTVNIVLCSMDRHLRVARRSATPEAGIGGNGTCDDNELWAIVAFVQRLPAISAEDYRPMERRLLGMP